MTYEYYQNISTIFIITEVILLYITNYICNDKFYNFVTKITDIFWCFIMSFIIVGSLTFLNPFSCIVNWSIVFAILNFIKKKSSLNSPLQYY